MKTRTIVIGCAVVLLLVCLGGAAVVLLGGGALAGVVNSIAEGPYQVGKRPTPSSADIETLLPAKVGGFTRGDVNKVQDGEVNTVYTSGSTTINITAEVYTSAGSAAGRVAQIKEDVDPSTPVAGKSNKSSTSCIAICETSYVKVVTQDGKARLVYNKGKYVFDVTTGTEGDMDSFMKDFPF